MRLSSRKIYALGAKLGLTILLLAWVLWDVNWNDLGETLFNANISLVLLAVVVTFARTGVLSRRWQLLLAAQGVTFTYKDVFSTCLTCRLFDSVTPANIGGDIYRVKWAKAGVTRGGLTVLWDRFFGLVSQLFLLIVGIAACYHLVFVQSLLSSLFTLFFAAAAILALVMFGVQYLSGKTLAMRKSRLGLRAKLQRLSGINDLQRLPLRIITACLAWSLLGQGLVVLTYYCVLQALGLADRVPAGFLLLAVSVVTLCVSLPISISGLGVSENLFAVFFAIFGVPIESSIAFSWLVILIVRGSGIFIGGLILMIRTQGAERTCIGEAAVSASKGEVS